MGVDFVAKCAKTFRRAWDRGRWELAQPDLFTAQPQEVHRTYAAYPVEDHTFQSGEQYVVEVRIDNVGVYLGTSLVGLIADPPELLKERIISQGCGVALGTVAATHNISGVADISID